MYRRALEFCEKSGNAEVALDFFDVSLRFFFFFFFPTCVLSVGCSWLRRRAPIFLTADSVVAPWTTGCKMLIQRAYFPALMMG